MNRNQRPKILTRSFRSRIPRLLATRPCTPFLHSPRRAYGRLVLPPQLQQGLRAPQAQPLCGVVALLAAADDILT